MRYANNTTILHALRVTVRHAGSVNAFAKRHGLSQSYVSQVLSGSRGIGAKIAKALDFDRVVLYRKRAHYNKR